MLNKNCKQSYTLLLIFWGLLALSLLVLVLFLMFNNFFFSFILTKNHFFDSSTPRFTSYSDPWTIYIILSISDKLAPIEIKSFTLPWLITLILFEVWRLLYAYPPNKGFRNPCLGIMIKWFGYLKFLLMWP